MNIAIPIRKDVDICENWVSEGFENMKDMAQNLKSIYEKKGTLEEYSDALWKNSSLLLAPILQAALQDKADSMVDKCACPKCNTICSPTRQMPRTLDTRCGTITVKRYYYSCSECNAGFFPFDKELLLTPTRKQADMQKTAINFLTEVPYAVASELFEDSTGLLYSDHAMHELAANLESSLQLNDILPTPTKIQEIIDSQARPGKWKPVLVVTADGAHVPTRPESLGRDKPRGSGEWREAKGFRIYLAVNDRIIDLMNWHQICDEEQFGKDIMFASSLISHHDVRIALVGDGAPWIWNHLTAAFPDGQEILDYYHCKEHIHKVAKFQYSQNIPQQQAWVESSAARLFYGEVESVIWGLQRMRGVTQEAQDEIDKLITYLTNNSHRINYDSARKRQFPCGSGGIESANKSICHVRLKRSGAWWNIENANIILALRCAKVNGTLEYVRRKHIEKKYLPE